MQEEINRDQDLTQLKKGADKAKNQITSQHQQKQQAMVEEYNNLIQQEKEEIEWIKSEIEEKKDIKHEKKTFEEEYTQWTYLNQWLDE